jgi:hypothetical protein
VLIAAVVGGLVMFGALSYLVFFAFRKKKQQGLLLSTTESGPKSPLVPLSGGLHSIVQTSEVSENDFRVDIGRIKKGSKIGGGGFGSVFKGEYQGKSCAIKVIRRPLLEDVDLDEKMSREREGLLRKRQAHIMRETTILARLRHPNIVDFWGFAIDHRNCVWLLMEICPGISA